MTAAAKILKLVQTIFFFFLGALLFLFILLYIVLSFIVRLVNKLLKVPGLYHFREKEFPLLDVSEGTGDGEYHHFSLGTLPTKQAATVQYVLPADLAVTAKELMLRVNMETRPGAANYEFEYIIYETGAEAQKQYIYLFINPFPEMPDISFTESTFWFPVPKSKKLELRFVNAHPGETDAVIKTALEIVRWR